MKTYACNRARRGRDTTTRGLYYSNSFCIELPPNTVHFDESGQELFCEDLSGFVTFVHEYWHFLQNSSTTGGLLSYVADQCLLSPFSKSVQNGPDGECSGERDLVPQDIAKTKELTHKPL